MFIAGPWVVFGQTAWYSPPDSILDDCGRVGALAFLNECHQRKVCGLWPACAVSIYWAHRRTRSPNRSLDASEDAYRTDCKRGSETKSRSIPGMWMPGWGRGTLSRSQGIRNLSSMVWRALYRANNSAFHTKGTTVNSSVLSKEECGVRDFLDSGKALNE